MQKLLIILALAILPACGFAAAPDVPTSAAAPSWSGFYLGVTGGYGEGNHDAELIDTDHRSRGWIGGGLVGYNHQINSVVIGVEADAATSDIRSSDNVTAPVLGGTSSVDIEHHIEYFGTVRARVGYALGKYLPYVTAGYAHGRNTSKGDATISGLTGPYATLNGRYHGSDGNTHTGWAAGIGLEAFIAPNLTARIEYLHLDLGSESYVSLPQLDTTPRGHDVDVDAVRFAISYKFGGR